MTTVGEEILANEDIKKHFKQVGKSKSLKFHYTDVMVITGTETLVKH
jgi:hypothetical protein